MALGVGEGEVLDGVEKGVVWVLGGGGGVSDGRGWEGVREWVVLVL